jgi:hypothetical protein
MHLLKRPGGKGPFMHGGAADAQRIVEALVHPSAVSLGRHAEAMDPHPGHELISHEFRNVQHAVIF